MSDFVRRAPDGIVALDSGGRVTTFNAAASLCTGWSEAEVLGRPFSECGFVPAPERSATEATVQSMLRGERVGTVEWWFAHRDGSPRFVEVAAQAAGRTELAAVFLVFRDVTDRKHMQELLASAQRMETVGRLAGGIAHDFNNVLSVVVANAETMRAVGDLTPLHQELLGEIDDATQRASSLTRQLVAFSRKIPVEPKTLQLTTIVADLEPMLRRTISESVRLSVDLPSDVGFIVADPTQIEQVVMNLAVNARAAMPDGGRLRISVGHVERTRVETGRPDIPIGQYVSLTVDDSGVGMGPATLSRIFEPFFTRKKHSGGSGLGLATVQGIVTQSHGHIIVTSSPGAGTRFELLFPRVDPPSRQTQPPKRGSSPDAQPHGAVLLVEDDEPVRHATARMLEHAGFSVIAAASARDALRIVDASRPHVDIVLTDIVLPDVAGVDLAERLRGVYPQAAIVYMSGYPRGTDETKEPAAPADAWLPKPFTARDLGVALDRLRKSLN